MALSDKLYELRKKSGLSQEQLAEQLHVSRQAVSKWESGAAMPESEKLLAVSKYFDVSLDYLMKDENAASAPKEEPFPRTEAPKPRRELWTLGLVLCFAGILCLILWGVLSALAPAASEQITQSAAIRLDGSGIFLLLCVAALVIGAMLLLKHTPRK